MGPRKILVVDDDQVIRKTLSLALSTNGFAVFTAPDGPGAVSIVNREKPDLIVLDITFPPDAANINGALQDGFFIMEWIRRMGDAHDIPVIMISADTSSKCRDHAMTAGAVGFFVKPVDRFELIKVIRATLGETAPDAVAAA